MHIKARESKFVPMALSLMDIGSLNIMNIHFIHTDLKRGPKFLFICISSHCIKFVKRIE
jgi:hypothetical protein